MMDEISVELSPTCSQKRQFEEKTRQVTTLPYGFHKISYPEVTYSSMDRLFADWLKKDCANLFMLVSISLVASMVLPLWKQKNKRQN